MGSSYGITTKPPSAILLEFSEKCSKEQSYGSPELFEHHTQWVLKPL